MRRFALLTLLALAACGADGPPQPPLQSGTPAVSMTGSTSAGMARDGG